MNIEMLFKNILPGFHISVLTCKKCVCVCERERERERERMREVQKGKVATYFGISCYLYVQKLYYTYNL